MAAHDIGESFLPRARQIESPAPADKMLGRTITRVEVQTALANNEIVEAYEHDDRVRYVLLSTVAGRSLHVVIGEDDVFDVTVVPSAREPDSTHGWDPTTGYRTRRKGDRGQR